MKSMTLLALIGLGLMLGSCSESAVETVTGFKPIYGTVEDLNSIISNSEKDLENPGKIYVKGNMLLVNEVFEGVHIYDNSNPSDPQKVSFIAIPGNMDVSIKGDIMYANYLQGLVTIDISDLFDVSVLDFNTELSPTDDGQDYPPTGLTHDISNEKVYFECVDDSKGMVIGWEEVKMPKPNCYLNR